MTLKIADPIVYFKSEHFPESELRSFYVKPSEQRITVVVLFAARTLGAYFTYLQAGGLPENYQVNEVDFRMLSFHSVNPNTIQLRVNDAVETPVDRDEAQWLAYEKNNISTRGRLITSCSCVQRGGECECAMYFDSLGEHIWRFGHLAVERKLVQVLRQDSRVVGYRDIATGDSVDFFSPFEIE